MADTVGFSSELISALPLADIPVPGVTARLLQAGDKQVLFMEFSEGISVPEHAHEAQWGVVVEGQLELTLSGRKKVYKKGDTFFIPKGASHTAKYSRGYKDVAIYDSRDRYKVKKG